MYKFLILFLSIIIFFGGPVSAKITEKDKNIIDTQLFYILDNHFYEYSNVSKIKYKKLISSLIILKEKYDEGYNREKVKYIEYKIKSDLPNYGTSDKCSQIFKGYGMCDMEEASYEYQKSSNSCIIKYTSGCNFYKPFHTLNSCETQCVK